MGSRSLGTEQGGTGTLTPLSSVIIHADPKRRLIVPPSLTGSGRLPG